MPSTSNSGNTGKEQTPVSGNFKIQADEMTLGERLGIGKKKDNSYYENSANHMMKNVSNAFNRSEQQGISNNADSKAIADEDDKKVTEVKVIEQT